jgi:peptidoglycan hydrolase-like protein with peptidoglycan-binding domain
VQLLAQLGYLPVTWTPSESTGDVSATDANAQLSAAYDPPAGSFSFHSGYPTTLTSQWSVGSGNIIVQGAVRTFEYDQGLTMDGLAGPSVWSHLFNAVATGKRNEHGYTYVYVSQSGNEHMTLYHDGRVALTTLVNTGIAGRGTADGTYPVYERFQDTIMSGTNPDGSKYHDNVQWVSYFNGGDAVHYFDRYGYGYYQSLGCVELPYDPAVKAYNLMTYGTLVTVAGPEA